MSYTAGKLPTELVDMILNYRREFMKVGNIGKGFIWDGCDIYFMDNIATKYITLGGFCRLGEPKLLDKYYVMLENHIQKCESEYCEEYIPSVQYDLRKAVIDRNLQKLCPYINGKIKKQKRLMSDY